MKKNYQHQHFPVHGYTIWQRIPQACKKSEKILMQPIVTCAGCGKRIVPQKQAFWAAVLSASMSFGIGFLLLYSLIKVGLAYLGFLLCAVAIPFFDLVVPGLIFASIPWKISEDEFTEDELEDERLARMEQRYRDAENYNMAARLTIARFGFILVAKALCNLLF